MTSTCAKFDDLVLQLDLRTADLLCKVHTGKCHSCSYVINCVEIVQHPNISEFHIRSRSLFVLKRKTLIDFVFFLLDYTSQIFSMGLNF